MGARLSTAERSPSPDLWWPDTFRSSVDPVPECLNGDANMEPRTIISLEVCESSEDRCAGDDSDCKIRQEENQMKLEAFKKEVASKREARHSAIAALADKQRSLEERLSAEQCARIQAENQVARYYIQKELAAERKRLKKRIKVSGLKNLILNNLKLKELLAEGPTQEELDTERKKVHRLEEELLCEAKARSEWEHEREGLIELERQIRTLNEVASIGKEMLRIRELQVNELKKKLCQTQYPEDLREEYEAQIENVRRLKTLYEERAETIRLEHRGEIQREISKIALLESKVAELEREREEAESMREYLKSQIRKLDKELEERNDTAVALQEQLDATIVECRDLASQMNSINDVFTRMLVGSTSADCLNLEIDPSTVADSLNQERENIEVTVLKDNDDDGTGSSTSQQEAVAENLPKIWEILVQLSTRDDTTAVSTESCYKSVDTPTGKRSVISVSQTFLKLKNLILEKNALIKEVNKLKVLNSHLELRLGNQEKRLTTVSTELKKTWGVVNTLRTQHRQLHTQEKILKYELQHKRSLLNDLKDELERCKEIWDMARQKNCQSEEDWKKLRKEFADRRKNQPISNSIESGYEDDDSNSPMTERSIDEDQHIEDQESNSLSSEVDLRGLIEVERTEADDSDGYALASNKFGTDLRNTEVARSPVGGSIDSKDHIYENDREASTSACDYSQQISISLDKASATNISKFLEGLIVNVDEEIPEDKQAEAESTCSVKKKKSDFKQTHSKSISVRRELQNDRGQRPEENSASDAEQSGSEKEESVLPQVTVGSCLQDNLQEPSRRLSQEVSSPVNTSGSSNAHISSELRTTAQVLDARTERLKRLEEQCKSLFNKVTATSIKSNVLSSKLELLHEQYGRTSEVNNTPESPPNSHEESENHDSLNTTDNSR